MLTLGVGQMWGLSSTVTIGSTNYPTAQTGTTVSGTGDLSSTWNVTVVANYFNGNDNGIHAGSNGQTATSIVLTSSSFSGKTITAVSVTGRDANSTQNNRAVFTAKVNGSAFGSTSRFTTSSDTYTATGNVVCTGNVSVEVVRSSAVTKAIYVSAVSVTFNNGGTTYTVTYSLNGGTGTTPTESAKAKDATFSLHNGTTSITAPSGKIFSKWKDQDNNEYNGGDTYTMPAKNVTLTAQWVNAYTVTYNLNGGTGTTPTESKKAAAATFTLHDGTTGITAPAGKGFNKWKDQDGNEYDASDTYTMPAKNVTLTAQWIDLPSYSLVTSVSQLYDGAKIIIANEDMDRALSTNQRTANREAVAVTCTNNVITPGNTVQIITLEASGDNWKFKVGTDSYLYASSSSSNELKTANATTSGNNGVWSISIANNIATVVAQGTNTRDNMRYNPNNNNPNLFACYASSSANGKVKLFIEPPTKATLTFDLNDKTLSSGSLPDDITNVTLDEAYTLPTTTLGATGYTFVGWHTNKNAASSQSSITPSEATTYTLYAIWTPNTNTAYTVKHYKQNLDGTYPSSPTETDNLTGTTDASVTPARKSYTGFTAPNSQTVTILPNGSRVVTYNYTRNSYTLTWSLDGGSISSAGTAAGSVKYEASLTAPTVTKTGYTFNAWSPAVPSTMPAANSTYTATWNCKDPEIETDLSTAQVDYIKDVTATALTISASANGASLNYAWEKSANGTSGWSPVGINNSSYTPLTDEVGDQYYRCTVTNAVAAGCSSATATSTVAHIHVVAPSVCLTPSFSPATGTYVGSRNVEISSTAGATIYYTTDGSDPKTSGTRSTYSSAISVNETTTIRAYAEKAEMTASAEGSATITIKCAAPTFTPAQGAYVGTQNVVIASEYGTVYYTTDGSDPATNGTPYSTPIAVSTTNTTIKAIAKKANCANSDLAIATYTIACATPTFSPEEGTYTGTQNVTISSTDGATIYYTTDGTTPDNTKSVYSSAIPVSANTTIKAIAVKDGLSQSAIGSATYSIKYTVTLNAGTGSVSDGSWTESEGVWTKAQTAVGGSITLPNAASGVSGWNFSGWKTGSAVTTQTDVKPDYVATTYTPTSDITLYAVYEKTSGGTAVDEITRDFIGVTSSTYTAWSSKNGSASSAVYAGQSAGGDNQSGDAIQLRTNNSNSGIITTASGGKAKKVTVTWNDYTSATRTITIYGKNTAYSAASNLYSNDDDTKGEALGELNIDDATESVSELTITGDYEYIGIRSKSGALYLDEVDIEWSNSSTSYYSNPSDKVTLTYDANGATAGSAPTAVSNITIGEKETVAAKPEALAKTGYDFGGWNIKADGTGTNYAAGTGEITMTDNITLYAKWTKHNFTVAVASVDHTAITATPEGGSAIAEGSNAAVAYEKEVSLAKTDDPHFTVAWDVYETGNSSNKVTVSENKFTVPAFDVTVSATITEDAKRNVKFYSNGTQLGTTQEVYVGEKPVAETAVYESCLEGSNMFYGWATEEWIGAIDASTLAGKTVYTGTLPDVEAGEGDVEFYAIWAAGNKANTFNLLSDANDFISGADYIIASYESSKDWKLKAENYDSKTYQQVATDVTISANYEETDGKYIWTITNEGGNYVSIYNAETEKYLAIIVDGSYTNLVLQDSKATFTKSVTDGGEYSDHFEFAANSRYVTFYSSSNPYYNAHTSTDGALYLYKRDVTYSDFRINCCALKPVTNVQVGTIGETSVELTWTAPTSKTGITKYQIVDAEHSIAQDVTNVDAIKATVTGLTECTTYNFKVVSVGSECSSNSNEVEATPFAGAKVVTFDYNGGSGATTSASTSCGVETVNLPTPNARDGYNFKGWNDGTQTLAPSTATYTPAATMTLTAQWAQLYTVHYEFAGASGAPEDAQYEAGATVELPSEPNKGFLAPFKAWDYAIDVTKVDATHFTMPASNLTITATYDEIVGQWILVTDESQLVANSYVIIAAANANKAIKTTQNGTSYRYITDITKSGSIIENPSNDVQIFVLREGTVDDSWAFQCLNGDYKDKYIYANSSSNNYMSNQVTNNANSSWKLDLEHGYATAQGDNTRNILSFNNDRFACYGNTNQGAIAFYEFREGTFYDVNMPAVAPTGGTVSANTSMAKVGETVTLTYTPSRGYTVKTLTVTGATSGSIAISPALVAGVTEYTFTMPAEAVTVAASFEAVPPVDYNLVTDAANLAVGVQFLIVSNETNGYRAAATRNGEYLYAISIEDPETNKVSITTEDVVDFILSDKDGENWVISSIEGKLSATNSGAISYNGANDKWGISISEGDATISNGDYTLRYNYNNGTNPRFKTYANATGEIPALYALPYTTYNFELSGCKTIKVATGYTYTYPIKSTDVPSVTPEGYEFLNKWTDGTNTYAVGDEVTVSATKTLQPCWKVTTPAATPEDPTTIDAGTLPAGVRDVVVTENVTLNVTSTKTLDNLTVEAGGTVSGSANLTVNDLTIKTSLGTISGDDNTGGKSGQITNSNITASGDVFIEIELTQAPAATYGWYAFSVPFEVDALNGVYYQSTKLTNEVGYAIMKYHEDIRSTGAYAWKKYRDIMQPGELYIITVADTDYKTLRFKKHGNTAFTTSTSVAVSKTGDDTNSGWNGLGNPNLQVSYTTAETYMHFLDHEANAFKTREASKVNLTVGSAFFIQYSGSEDHIDLTVGSQSGEGTILLAPARNKKSIEEVIHEVKIFKGDKEEDNIFFTAREEATNSYEIGRDVAKMSMGTANCAQMMIPAYGTNLCAADFPLVNDKVEYPLTITAPEAGEYRIETAEDYADATIYLTYNGRVIWNLSMSPYEAELVKGQNSGYGLKLVASPRISTGIDSVTGDGLQVTGVQKVIIDEHVFILRNGQMYDATGKAVK